MKIIKTSLLLIFYLNSLHLIQAHVTPKLDEKPNSTPLAPKTNFSADCDQPKAQIEQSINNVRARLLTGGDMWWNPEAGKGSYIVPKRPPSEPQVSAIFAAGVWIGGLDPGGNLKLAAQQYGSSNGEAEYYPGPLDAVTGSTEKEICSNWDKFFKVTSIEIDEHLSKFNESVKNNTPYQTIDIPSSIKGWPARGNPYFYDVHGFNLPNTTQGLASFWDQDRNGIYEPQAGDYPTVEIRGCVDRPQHPDEMIFWIYNDAGGYHFNSNSDPIQMEVQVTAFAYQTNDQFNDMTFQKYKLINRAIESIDSTYFGLWVDGDLGCFTDDYIGCDTTRSLAYYYNADAIDGQFGCECPQNVPTYCDEIPILGIDFIRGPLNEFGRELEMSSFTYYGSNPWDPPVALVDPSTTQEYYNYLTGSWRTGAPIEYGGDGYQEGTFETNYVFPSAPDDSEGWSMCSAALDNPPADRKTIQSAGPFRLDPGAVNELLFGVVWIPDQDYPCPSIRALQAADDKAQCLFDNCFQILDNGPDAPDLDIIELDQALVFVLSNDEITSNNAHEAYAEVGLKIPDNNNLDSLYLFEGYKVYQLSGADVRFNQYDDPDLARLVFHVDKKNKVEKIYNWENISSPENLYTYTPVLMNEGVQNQGIRHTFKITEDQFATGDRKLINHKKYYFVAIAYAHNNYELFDPIELTGQMTPYIQSIRNTGDGQFPHYTAIPRPIVDQNLNTQYGDGAIITRLDGVGAGGNFLELNEATELAILDGSFTGELTYKMNAGPIEILIVDPLTVQDGEYVLTFKDENLNDETLETNARWELKNLNNPAEIIVSEVSIEQFNEQVIPQYGFSVLIGQTTDVGDTLDVTNGAIGARESYETGAIPWFQGIADDIPLPNFPSPFDLTYDFIPTAPLQIFNNLDPYQSLSRIGNGYWMPYRLLLPEPPPNTNIPFLSPIWSNASGTGIANNRNPLHELNNVDIVFTDDKSKWSRCVIVETWNEYYAGLATTLSEGNRNSFDVRAAPSVGKEDKNGDNLPDPDGEVDETGLSMEGMGWFPGYAIDVETGQRLNIFFGENSLYRPELENEFPSAFVEAATGADMMWNPTDQAFIAPSATNGTFSLLNFMTGGQHSIYVTRQPYDECAFIYSRLKPSPSPLRKISAIQEITWTCMPYLQNNSRMKTYAEGLIPANYRVQLRVNNPYQVEIDTDSDPVIDTRTGTGEFNYYPTYQFKLEGVQANTPSKLEIDAALNLINVVPNPYYAYSSYETSADEGIVKITNLPAQCEVTIYSIKGDLIRHFVRNERPVPAEEDKKGVLGRQIYPDLEWDLNNKNGQLVSSGIYLIRVDAGTLGERTLKWLGLTRQP